MLVNEVNIIINSAGNVDMNCRLDLSVKTNVFGALQLMELAEDCKQIECFCQVSTCYAIIDNHEMQGPIEERIVRSPFDWGALYRMISEMSVNDVTHY